MSPTAKRGLSAAAGVAFVLVGMWVAGFVWERGACALFVYLCVVFAGFIGASYPHSDAPSLNPTTRRIPRR